MTGYVRQSTANIQAGLVVASIPLNLEFDTLQNAFHATTGHSHDGSTGNAPLIGLTTSVTGVLPAANGGTALTTGLTVLDATNLTSGTVATARGGTGVATGLTVLNGTNISSGTVADARLPTSMATKTLTGTTTVSGLLSATGGQIQFPAVQVPSAGVNVLDDYEEGIFTPGMTINGSAAGITYGSRVGIYTKIGNRCDIIIYVPLTNKGASTGIIQITGLPFTPTSGSIQVVPISYEDCLAMTGNECGILSSTTVALIRPSVTTSLAFMPDASLTNNSIIGLRFSYIVA